MTRRGLDTYERVEIASREDLHRWLDAHQSQSESVWLVTWKASRPDLHVPYAVVVDEAVSFGWIDSLPRRLDAERSLRLLSPRKPGSSWSRVNQERVKRLTETGRMQPAGLAKVAQAQADGSWSRLDEVESLSTPPDLDSALRSVGGAQQNFQAFPRSARRAILEWINSARRPDTRAKRIEETARDAAEGRRANQPRQPRGTPGAKP